MTDEPIKTTVPFSLGDLMRAPEITDLVQRSSNYSDADAAISADQARLIILAALRLHGCRVGSEAALYASDALQEALGEEMLDYFFRLREFKASLVHAGHMPAPREPSDDEINAAAECMWNDRDARLGGPWVSRRSDEVVVVQTRATARAAIIAARKAAKRGDKNG